LLHVDIKPVGRIHGIGHRIHGDRTRRARGAGYEYAHVAVDDATRLAFVEVHASQQQEACATSLRARSRGFGAAACHPAPLLTDNGPAYKSRRRRRLPRVGGAPSIHPALSAADQRQKRNGLSKRSCANGPIRTPIARPPPAPRPSRRLCSSTITGARTPASARRPPGAAFKRLSSMNNLFDIHA